MQGEISKGSGKVKKLKKKTITKGNNNFDEIQTR